jgi:hypothetical protein
MRFAWRRLLTFLVVTWTIFSMVWLISYNNKFATNGPVLQQKRVEKSSFNELKIDTDKANNQPEKDRNVMDSYSFFEYHGSNGYENANDRLLWHFTNVCYENASNSLIYYQDPSELISPPVWFSNGIHYDFPALDSNVKIVVTKGELPKDAVFMEPDVVVLRKPMLPFNWGHFFADNIFPVFHALKVLGLPVLLNDTRLLWLDEQSWKGDPSGCEKNCDKFINDWLLMPKTMYDPRTGVLDVKSRKLTCFKHLIAGVEHFSFSRAVHADLPNAGWADSYREFRDYFREKIAGLKPSDRAKFQQILLVKKNGRRHFLNHDEIASYLRKVFPTVSLKETDFASLSPKEQLELLTESTVIVSPPGAVSMIAMFSADSTVGIYSDYWIPSKRHSHGMEQHFYQILPWFTNYQYPILNRAEVKITTEDKRELQADINRKYRMNGSTWIDLKRMAMLVYSALRHIQRKRGDGFKFDENAFKSVIST